MKSKTPGFSNGLSLAQKYFRMNSCEVNWQKHYVKTYYKVRVIELSRKCKRRWRVKVPGIIIEK